MEIFTIDSTCEESIENVIVYFEEKIYGFSPRFKIPFDFECITALKTMSVSMSLLRFHTLPFASVFDCIT